MTEVELSLWERYSEHEETAQEKLIVLYYPLVVYLATAVAGRTGARWESLRQDAVLGLVKAIAEFDPGHNLPFRAFAKAYILRAIFDSPELTRKMARKEDMAFATDNGLNWPEGPLTRPGSPQALLKALDVFAGDEEALREHFEEIAQERRRQREEAAGQDL